MTLGTIVQKLRYTSVFDKAQEAKGTPSLLTPEELLLIQEQNYASDSQLRLYEKAELARRRPDRNRPWLI
jgi:hypothetical protein